MRLESGVAMAMAQANSCSSDSTPSLRTSICCGCGPKNNFFKKFRKNDTLLNNTWVNKEISREILKYFELNENENKTKKKKKK